VPVALEAAIAEPISPTKDKTITTAVRMYNTALDGILYIFTKYNNFGIISNCFKTRVPHDDVRRRKAAPERKDRSLPSRVQSPRLFLSGNIIMKYIIVFIVFIIFIIIDMNFDTYGALVLINKVFFKCSDPAVLNPNQFEWVPSFRANWKSILAEYQSYTKDHSIPYHYAINEHVASCDLEHMWQTLYLRAYGVDTDLSQHFPLTMSLINSCPCTLAYFSVLKPRAKLAKHVGLYKGVIRYHLGLIIPTDWKKCFINVNGYTLYWGAGADMMFDDTFEHYVENNTDEMRVILFLDIKRDFRNNVVNQINDEFLQIIKTNDVLTDTVDNINSLAKQT
jgi:aspartyl/asparaginyl beta-hydroxylase (cupin superfamily)